MSVTFDNHPFLSGLFYTVGSMYMPPQMIPLSKKLEGMEKGKPSKWMQKNMDALEAIALHQYMKKADYTKFEKLAKGEFFASKEYLCEDCSEESSSTLQNIIERGGLPNTFKHFDIISPIIKDKIIEFSKLPDNIRVVVSGERVETDLEKEKKGQIFSYVDQKIENIIKRSFIEAGIDVENMQELSEEEQQKILQQMQQIKEAETPEEYAEFKEYDYRHIAAIWGEYEMLDQKERFSLDRLRRLEFTDLITFNERVRHLYFDSNGLNVRKVHPRNCFSDTNISDDEFIQDGEYAGEVYILTTSDLINKKGHLMSEEQLKSLDTVDAEFSNKVEKQTGKKDWFGNTLQSTTREGLPYGVPIATPDASLNRFVNKLGMNSIFNSNVNLLTENNQDYYSNLWTVCDAYWWSYEQVGRLSWVNPLSETYEVIFVDEEFKVPSYIKVLKDGNMDDKPVPNTITWTWKLRLWQGTKIRKALHTASEDSDMYLNIRPYPYVSPETSRLFKKLPIVGQKPKLLKSMVSTLEGYQFFNNVFMNKGMKMIENSLLPFLIFDTKIIPKEESYSGEDALMKYIDASQEAGVVPANTSISNTGSQTIYDAQYPKVIDLDVTPRVIQYFKLSSEIKRMAYETLGFPMQNIYSQMGQDPKTGVDAQMSVYSKQASVWYQEFWDCEQDIMNIQLKLAQLYASQEEEIRASFTHSDFTKAFLKFNNEGFHLFDIGVYITDAQEELRKIANFQQIALQNTNPALVSTRMKVMSMSSSERILEEVIKSERELQAREQEIQQLKQQEINAKTEQAKIEAQARLDIEQRKMENNLRVAYIRASGYLGASGQDLDNSGISDSLEYDRLKHQADVDFKKIMQKDEKQKMDQEESYRRKLESEANLALKARGLDLKERQINASMINSRIMDKGEYKGAR